jgi:hypothetical protein
MWHASGNLRVETSRGLNLTSKQATELGSKDHHHALDNRLFTGFA